MADENGVNVKKPKAADFDWDNATEEERRAENRRLQEAEAAGADTFRDPAFDRLADGWLGKAAIMFKQQARYLIQLSQVTPQQEAAGQKPLPDRECGVNGYNFVVPRGVPVDMPESLVWVLYEAGEITPLVMHQHKLITKEQLMDKMRITKSEADKLAKRGKVLEV